MEDPIENQDESASSDQETEAEQIPKPQVQTASVEQKDPKLRLLDYINQQGKLPISIAAEALDMEDTQIATLSEELKKEGKIRMEPHYLKEPELESLDYRKIRRGLATKEKIDTDIKLEAIVQPNTRQPNIKKEVTVLDEYDLTSDDVTFKIKILDTGDFVPHYLVAIPRIDFVTRALLDETKKALIGEVSIVTKDVYDPQKFQKLKLKFVKRAREKLEMVLKKSSHDYIATLSKILVNEMLGLGDIEYLLLDNGIEEIVVNSSKDVVWIYHKKYKWVKTNIILPTETLITNYASRIAREVGREITHLKPLLDAHLSTGDRVNATLAPISTQGNTITIRRFSRTPWSAVYLMQQKYKTVTAEVAAFLWMAIEYELSIIVNGGTAAGKTSMLNAIMPFMPANQRIISIEDTREINLPDYLQWIPLTTREASPDGEGGITMLDLLQNSLRMRPDRIIIGEVRAKREAEVMFEAMHTGHSCYASFHAERAQEVIDRIISPPMSIPGGVLKSLHLIVCQYRNRRTGQRRTFEICELLKDDSEVPKLNILYKWDPRTDNVNRMYPSIRIRDEIALFTGMTEEDLENDIMGKKAVLEYLLRKNINDVNKVGQVVTEYYMDKDKVLDIIAKDGNLNLNM